MTNKLKINEDDMTRKEWRGFGKLDVFLIFEKNLSGKKPTEKISTKLNLPTPDRKDCLDSRLLFWTFHLLCLSLQKTYLFI